MTLQDPIEYDVDLWNSDRRDRKIVHLDLSEPCRWVVALCECGGRGMDEAGAEEGWEACRRWWQGTGGTASGV